MSDFTIILSRTRSASAQQRRFEDDLLSWFRGRFAAKTFVLPHIYDLKNSGSTVKTLREQDGDWIVFSWMYPRAAYWTLRAFGIQGTQVEAGKPTPIRNGARTIECLNMNDFADAGEAESKAEALLRERGLIDETAESAQGEPGEVEVLDEMTLPRWYPVVDVDACGNCLECLNFCLFGVYSVDENDALFVEIPDACRNGCPACSRVCPQGAIMFPEHSDPTVAGGTVTTADTTDTAQQEKAAAEQAAAQKPATQKPASLDALVDELDKFEG